MLGEKRSKEKFNILKMSTHEKTTNLGYLEIVIFVWKIYLCRIDHHE